MFFSIIEIGELKNFVFYSFAEAERRGYAVSNATAAGIWNLEWM
jgi:hypothetical protein